MHVYCMFRMMALIVCNEGGGGALPARVGLSSECHFHFGVSPRLQAWDPNSILLAIEKVSQTSQTKTCLRSLHVLICYYVTFGVQVRALFSLVHSSPSGVFEICLILLWLTRMPTKKFLMILLLAAFQQHCVSLVTFCKLLGQSSKYGNSLMTASTCARKWSEFFLVD